MLGLLGTLFLLGHLGSKLDATAHDATTLKGDSSTLVLEISTGQGLSDMSSEGAKLLEVPLGSEAEVVDAEGG